MARLVQARPEASERPASPAGCLARDRSLVLLVLALGLALPGCGGTRPILKIGLSAPFTGWDESMGYEVIHSVRLALRERNQRGGAGGYNIELAALDDRNEPAEAAQQVRELAVDPDILGAVGGLDNEAMLAAAAEVHKAGLPFVIIGGTAAALTDQGYGEVFRLAPRDEAVAAAAVGFAAQTLQAKRLALVQDPAEAGLAAAFAAAVANAGMPVIYTGRGAPLAAGLSALVAELRARQADVVLFAGRVSEAGPLLEQSRAAGLRFALLGGPALDDARLGQLAGAGMEPCYAVGLAALDPASPFSAGYSWPGRQGGQRPGRPGLRRHRRAAGCHRPRRRRRPPHPGSGAGGAGQDAGLQGRHRR